MTARLSPGLCPLMAHGDMKPQASESCSRPVLSDSVTVPVLGDQRAWGMSGRGFLLISLRAQGASAVHGGSLSWNPGEQAGFVPAQQESPARAPPRGCDALRTPVSFKQILCIDFDTF